MKVIKLLEPIEMISATTGKSLQYSGVRTGISTFQNNAFTPPSTKEKSSLRGGSSFRQKAFSRARK
jgi:hypothetical protein